MPFWSGKGVWSHLAAPHEYHAARLKYADDVLDRAQSEFNKKDIDRLMVIYAPIIEKAKRKMVRRHGVSRRSDIDDAVLSEFLHMLQMYDSTRKRHLEFPNFLKRYFDGWCNRNLSQVMATTKKRPTILDSNSFEEDKESSYMEIVSGGAQVDVNRPDEDLLNRDIIRKGINAVKAKYGSRHVDALLLAYLYNYTHENIGMIIGCTQARVSQILHDAKGCFVNSMNSDGDDDA